MFIATATIEIPLCGSHLSVEEVIERFHVRWCELYERSWEIVAPEVRAADGILWAECAERDRAEITDVLEDVLWSHFKVVRSPTV